MARALIAVAIVVLALAIQVVTQRSITARYDYQCSKCGARFHLTATKASIAPHRIGGLKYVRCPTCGARSWVTPVARQSEDGASQNREGWR